MAYKVRRLTSEDRQAWQVLWKGYQDFYEADLDEITDSTWDRLMAANSDQHGDGPHGLVAEDESGELLGLTHYLFHGTTWSPEPRCYLNDLFTNEAARGRGIGRLLIKAVDQAAMERGAAQTYWLTQDFNEQARKLYDKVAKQTPFIKYMI